MNYLFGSESLMNQRKVIVNSFRTGIISSDLFVLLATSIRPRVGAQ